MASPVLTRQQLYDRYPNVSRNAIDVELYRLNDLRLVFLFAEDVELSPLGNLWWETHHEEYQR